jgi:2-polyprenyl-6-methoxyphenol hydroxylase-like FAD-dependent oxidoreductase
VKGLIAGGGIAGLTLAHGLLGAGVQREVLERGLFGRSPLDPTLLEARAAAYPLMELASDHSNFGGGGLRERAS